MVCTVIFVSNATSLLCCRWGCYNDKVAATVSYVLLSQSQDKTRTFELGIKILDRKELDSIILDCYHSSPILVLSSSSVSCLELCFVVV